MKLRNKKTGKVEAVQHNVALLHFSSGRTSSYHSLTELNAEWEDYKPKEPLIKDEKIRKAIKFIFPECAMIHIKKQGGSRIFEFGVTRLEVYAPDENAIKDGLSYLFEELCGEEEE